MDGKSGECFINFGATKDEFMPWSETNVEYMETKRTPTITVRADQAGEKVRALAKLCNKKEISL